MTRYCRKCGSRMSEVFFRNETEYDRETGVPVMVTITTLQCPNATPWKRSFGEFYVEEHDMYEMRS